MKNMKRCITELVGTAILVFVSAGIGILGGGDIVTISLTNGLIVLALIYALGHISGAHFNPAITLAFSSVGKFPRSLLMPYILSQLIGAIIAVLVLLTLFPYQIQQTIVKAAGLNMLGSYIDYSLLSIFTCELIISFIFMLVIMGVATNKRAADPAAAGLPIGLTVTALTLFAIRFSGAALNPARVFGPALINGESIAAWPYYLATIVGMILAARFYEFIRTTEAPRGKDFGVMGPIKVL